MTKPTRSNPLDFLYIKKLLSDRSMCSSCCGMCFAIFQDKYIKNFFSNEDLHKIKSYSVYKQSTFSFQNLDHIRKGKILENLLFEVKQIDSLENIDSYKFSALLGHLKHLYGVNFFKDELHQTYAGFLIQSWEKKQKERRKRLEVQELEQKKIRERNKLAKDLKKLRKDLRKSEKEIVRKTFLHNFSSLDPIKKLRKILEGIEIPLSSTPDSDFFPPNLDLRHKVREEFSEDELKNLRIMFGFNLKRNKRKIFRQILKVLR